MVKNKLTVGSMFAGIGGVCLGFQNAGYEVKWANEFDKYACETYRENFSHDLHEEDVHVLDPKKLGYVDVITSGFPCQAFSIAGYQKGFDDSRGNLFFETMRFVNELKPKVIFFENVKNLSSHDKGRTLKIIKETIVESGYSFISNIMNTKDYGNIPQTRDRIYIVGFKGEADYNLIGPLAGSKLSNKFNFPKKIPLTKKVTDLYEEEVDFNKYYYGEKFMGDNGKSFKILQEEITNKDTVYQWRRVKVRENKSNLCPTLTANMGTGGHNVPIIKDSIGIRKLTPRECIRFQGFPDKFVLPEKVNNGQLYKQIGNSVSVNVIKRIADSIKEVI